MEGNPGTLGLSAGDANLAMVSQVRCTGVSKRAEMVVLGRWGRLGLGKEGIFLLFVMFRLGLLGGPASTLA